MEPSLRKTRIICGAVATSALLFWGIVFALTEGGRSPVTPEFPVSASTLTAIALAAGLGAFIAALFFRSRAVGGVDRFSGRTSEPPSFESRMRVQTNLIVAWALLEGAALAIGVFYLLTGLSTLPIVAVVVVLAGFSVTFPRADWFGEGQPESWVNR